MAKISDGVSRRAFGLMLASVPLMSSPLVAQADWPTKPVRVLVPFGAGGVADITARIVTERLGDTLGQDKWHAAYNQLVVDLAARNIAQHKTDKGDMSLTLRLADAAFAQKGFDFVPAYLDTLAVHYDAGVKLLDFGADPEGARTLINGWVEDKTEQKIKDLLGQGTITDATRLVLVNALYFYGSWSTPFAKESTKAAAFHAPAGDVQADTMFAQLEAPYLEGDGFKATELPYDGGKVAMTIVLPDDGKLADVEAGLSNTWLSNLSVDLVGHGATVNLSLPKFKFTWGTKELKDSLQTLGMKDLFTLPPADLSGMQADKSLYVSHVVHKAFVGVDEYGTEAAAATAVVVDVGSAPNDPKVLTLDRPFLFFIRDTATGVVLFGGKVVDPTK